MTEPITVRVVDIVGGPICVSAEDGQRLHDKIAPLLREGKKIVLSFEQVDTLISAFLNAAIGQLYGEFSEDRLHELLMPPVGMDSDDLIVLKRVVENAKTYFKEPRKFDQAWKEEVGDEE